MLHRSGVAKSGRILDVGSGTSILVDSLVNEGYQHITALDISAAAFVSARQRLREKQQQVEWLVADIRFAPLSKQSYDVWHDRAVFHFLTDPKDRTAYIDRLCNTLKPGGQVIMATFADDGPEKCSDLTVMRYSPEALTEVLGSRFELLESERRIHTTPWNSEQRFIHCRYHFA